MVMSAKALLDRIENPTEEEIRNNGISNNLCRCTGYENILNAMERIVEETYKVVGK